MSQLVESIGRTIADLYSELQLPLDPTHETAAIEAIRSLCDVSSGSEEDLAILLEQGLAEWSNGAPLAALIQKAIAVALEVGAGEFGAIDGRQYLTLYDRLRTGTKDAVGLTHIVARRLLSRTSLIAHLLSAEHFSCSQVARLLHATESRLAVPYNAVQAIATILELKPVLDHQDAGADLWHADQLRALEYFPDSDALESCEVAGQEIARWAPEDDSTTLLSRLSKAHSEDEPTWPYLQILHWCTTALEFYDHPASHLYEFMPRGKAGEAVFSHYPAVTGNPVLNNAKAVASLDTTWARNRGSDDAHALVGLLTMLEALPFAARRQVARVLRAWLVRIIELRTVKVVPLDATLNHTDFLVAANYIENHETFTQGVIEQRIVDALAMLAFNHPGWRPKGVGDGINASNLSRHKLGDVEFANVDQRTAIALEAHGGHLSRTYVRDHQRSLGRILNQRLTESWADLDAPEKWTVRVIFVAHSRDTDGLPEEEVIHGVSVQYEYLGYGELTELAVKDRTPGELTDSFRTYVIDALNQNTVRQDARDKFTTLLHPQ